MKQKMKLIIEVDKKYYEACKDAVEESYPSQIEEVIANGTPYNPSGDCISRRVLKNLLSDKSIPIKFEEEKREEWSNSLGMTLGDIYTTIDNAPTVEPRIEYGTDGQPYKLSMTNGKEYDRPQGEWIIIKSPLSNETIVKCDKCGDEFIGNDVEDYNFCPNCGADMRKGGAE